MQILPIEENDLFDLAELYQQLIPNEISISKMKLALKNNKNNPNHFVWAAKIDGKLVGTALSVTCEMLFGQCKSFMVVEDVVVDQKYRGSGVGSDIMKHLEEHAKNHNCSYIMLITDTDRPGSQKFYKKLGYKTDEYCAFKKHIKNCG